MDVEKGPNLVAPKESVVVNNDPIQRDELEMNDVEMKGEEISPMDNTVVKNDQDQSVSVKPGDDDMAALNAQEGFVKIEMVEEKEEIDSLENGTTVKIQEQSDAVGQTDEEHAVSLAQEWGPIWNRTRSKDKKKVKPATEKEVKPATIGSDRLTRSKKNGSTSATTDEDQVPAKKRGAGNTNNSTAKKRKVEPLPDRKLKFLCVVKKKLMAVLETLPEDRKKIFGELVQYPTGSRAFTEIWAANEKMLMMNGPNFVIEVRDEAEFDAVKGELSHIHLIQNGVVAENKETATGFFVLKDFNLETMRDYILTTSAKKEKIDVVYSRTQKVVRMCLETFFLRFDDKDSVVNMISLEFSHMYIDKTFHGEFQLPALVRDESMASKLFEFLNEKVDPLNAQLRQVLKKEERKEVTAERDYWKRQLDHVHHYMRFILISNGGSFSDAHVDFGGTAVYYHVIEGSKIFYVAKNTPENMALYRQWETDRKKNRVWIGVSLWDKWQRIEIKAGNTAIIPPGFIHFVWTPVNSLVIGGNFLMERFLNTHFEFAQLDSEALAINRIKVESTYMHFYNLMWSYAKNIFLPEIQAKLDENRLPNSKITVAQSFLENLMKKLAMEEITFLSREEKEQVLTDLIACLKRSIENGQNDGAVSMEKVRELEKQVDDKIAEPVVEIQK